jgi:hypothetical protein
MLTAEQAEKLHAAVDRATGPGKCNYINKDAPACVIAQLGALHGVPVDTMNNWWGTVSILLHFKQPGTAPLLEYPNDTLESLQYIWDYAGCSADQLRKECHEYIAANS